MTCIAGLQHEGAVYIGGDSAGVSGWDLTIRSDPKVFRVGSFIMGFTTSFRMGQLLRYKLSLPQPSEEEDMSRYMATTFVDAVRTCLKDGGFSKVADNVETGGIFMVGYRQMLFCMYGDYQVEVSANGFNAVGCGGQAALGALCATSLNHPLLPPRDRVDLALSVAERLSGGVRRPFMTLSTAKEDA